MTNQPLRAMYYAGTGRLQSYALSLTVPPVDAGQSAFIAAELARHGMADEAAVSADPTRSLVELAIAAHAALLREASMFFPESAQIIEADAAGNRFTVAVPKIPTGGELSADVFVKVINRCASAARTGAPLEGALKALREELTALPQSGATAAHFARAAYELEMPMLEWRQPFLQIGHGQNAIVISGSITQYSPSIGVHFAREKSWTNAMLAEAGIPVAPGVLVKDAAHARQAAGALGYPVVLKPADRDGGTAVSSGIASPQELDAAFARARAASEKVLLEKHIEGLDYRLLFFGDELLVALERKPGGVTGNGRDTIRQLLDDTNRERTAAGSLLYQLTLDDEARIMLARQSLTLDSIAEDGRFVPLRRAANHALGGSVRVAHDIHPDNLDMALRAMRLLRLDIAGLDLILPDIAKSWHETGGVVCEINAQPFIGDPIDRDYYKEILGRIVPEGGRIPIVLVVGALAPSAIEKLAAAIPGLAVADRGGVRRDGRPLAPKSAPWQQAVRATLYDQTTSAVLAVLDPADPCPALSPVDRLTAAIVLDAPSISPALRSMLGRAGQIHALDPAALSSAGLEATPIAEAAVETALAALLSGKPMPSGARPKPAPRGKAPPASRKRR